MTTFSEFMIEEGVLSVTIGTILGFGMTNLAAQIRKHLFLPMIHAGFALVGVSDRSKSKNKSKNKSKLSTFIPAHMRLPVIELVSSIFELFLLVSVVVVAYSWAVKPIFQKEFAQQAKEEAQDKAWRTSMLDEVERIADKPTPWLT